MESSMTDLEVDMWKAGRKPSSVMLSSNPHVIANAYAEVAIKYMKMAYKAGRNIENETFEEWYKRIKY
jgi:hypothetical protein